MADVNLKIVCPVCGQPHSHVELKRGEKAKCARCGTLLARRSLSGWYAPLALAITALILAVPSCLLPFVTLSKFGSIRVSYLLSGVRGLWRRDMPSLAVWVLFCGILAPLVEMIILALVLTVWKRGAHDAANPWVKAAHRIQHWAMPEIHVLAVLVAFFKIGSLAETSTGPGFYCYVGAAFATLLAWQTFTREPERVAATQENGKK